MKAMVVVVSLAVAAFSSGAHAKIYKCKNEKGEIYYSQTFEPARCAGGGAQLNDQGLPVRTIERRKSPEELAAEKAEAERLAEVKRQEAAVKQADQVLMQSYANETDLTRAHEQELQMIESAIATAKLQLVNQQKTMNDFLGVAAESERAGKPVQEPVVKNIETVRTQIEEQNAFIARKEAEKVTANAAFATRLERYRALKAKQEQH
jgi:hypothetical protein